MKLNKTNNQLRFKRGLAANINATATKYLALEGEPHYTTDEGILYIFDGTQNMPVGNIVPTTRVTTTYTALITDRVIFADTDGGAFSLTLPAGVEGQTFRIANTGSSGNNLTVDGDGAEQVRGAATQTVADGAVMELTYNATDGWY